MDPVFAIRGLLSFVAFTEWTNSLRCFWPQAEEREHGYVNTRLFSGIQLDVDAERTLCHAYGLFSALVGIVIIYAAVYAHYRPLASLALCAESLKLLFLVAEAFIFRTILPGQHLIFPLVTGFVTVLSIVLLLFLTAEGRENGDKDENGDLVKQSRRLRKQK